MTPSSGQDAAAGAASCGWCGRVRNSATTARSSWVNSLIRWCKSVSMVASRASARSNPRCAEAAARHRDLGQVCGLLAELPRRQLVNLTKGGPFALDSAFEVAHLLAGVVLHPGLEAAEVVKARFELADRPRVPRAGGRPLIEDVGRALGQLREPLFRRLKPILGFAPEMERECELIDLRLQFSEALFELGDLLVHLSCLEFA
jgi:hypothetical protein